MGEVEVGFVFSNSIVHRTVKEPELPVVCSNKPKLGLHPEYKRLQIVRGKKTLMWTCNKVKALSDKILQDQNKVP